MQWLYLIAAILGTILPLSQFLPFLAAHGLNVTLFFQQLFQNPVSGFFGMDVIVSSLYCGFLYSPKDACFDKRRTYLPIVQANCSRKTRAKCVGCTPAILATSSIVGFPANSA
jgi:hypothetical protein